MLLYLLSKKIFQKIRPSPADGKADGGTWFGNFYLTFFYLRGAANLRPQVRITCFLYYKCFGHFLNIFYI